MAYKVHHRLVHVKCVDEDVVLEALGHVKLLCAEHM